jgi:hypothetical protein
MKYDELIKNLYSNSRAVFGNVLEVLEESVYITDCQEFAEEDIVIHTGFKYWTNKGQQVELLYHINKKIIIRQPYQPGLSPPTINGLVVLQSENIFFNGYNGKIVTQINIDGSFKYENIQLDVSNLPDVVDRIYVKDDNDKSRELSSILVMDRIKRNIKSYPLNREFNQTVYYNGVFFRQYMSDYLYFAQDYGHAVIEDLKYRKEWIEVYNWDAPLFYKIVETLKFESVDKWMNIIIFTKTTIFYNSLAAESYFNNISTQNIQDNEFYINSLKNEDLTYYSDPIYAYKLFEVVQESDNYEFEIELNDFNQR